MAHLIVMCITLLLFSASNTFTVSDFIPPFWETAVMARYIIHKADWVSIATLSSANDIEGFPFVNLKSMSDGPISKGKGIPYIYLTDMDLSGIDIKKDNRVTIMATLAQIDYCKSEDLDPQDPRCARVLITGKVVKVDKKTDEYSYAHDALFSRHPAMKKWPADHKFFIAKVDMQRIAVLDYFGGVKYVTVENYLNADNASYYQKNFNFRNDLVVIIRE